MSLIKLRYFQIGADAWQQPGRFRLAFLSDLHNNVAPRLIDQLKEAAPQVIVVGGDMVNRPIGPLPPYFTRGYGCVRRLAAEFPVYYAPGNHETRWQSTEAYRDDYLRYWRALEKKGVVFLDDACVSLGDEAHPLYLTGLSLDRAAYYHGADGRQAPAVEELKAKLGEARPFQILAAHHPDYFDVYRDWGADLVLAGHMHGGLVRLPGLGGVIGPDFHFFPSYTKGLYEAENGRMLVSPGMGTHTVPIRIFNPREAFIVDLVKE